MEIIKRKILLENSIDRNDNSPTYGLLTATSFYINVMLEQDIDDMGMFTDTSYLPNFPDNKTPVNYSILIDKLNMSGITFPFMLGKVPSTELVGNKYTERLTGKTVSDYYQYTNNTITAETESKIGDVRSYSSNQPYQINFNTNTENYTNYSGGTVDGVDGVTSLGNPTSYVFDTDRNDPNKGSTGQTSGLLYQDFTGDTNLTTVSFIGEGWNQTNTSLSAITKEEYLFGITDKPEIKNDVFIDRGITTILEKHLKLSEITNLSELSRYGKGYYNLVKQ